MSRLDNWNIRFSEALETLRESGVAFAWDAQSSQPIEAGSVNLSGQKFHCISFANYMVKAITGKDYYEELAAHLDYNSALSAMRAIKSLGFDSVDQLIGSIFPEIRRSWATRGDLVLVPGNFDAELSDNPEMDGMRLALGVADPPFVLVIHPEFGLGRVSIQKAVKAFHVE